MKKLILALLVFGATTVNAADVPPPAEFSMPTHVAKTPVEKVIRVKIDISESDLTTYGLQQSAIYNEIATRLSLGTIQIKDDPSAPQLILRVKAIQADRAVAAFIQLGFFEDATLVRNQSTVQALTWSQATMLSCAKEDLSKEVAQVIIGMTNSFILDYQKAMVPL
ncbi:MAG: hypothetical protein LLF94_12750 [Chlamydiales bacterium]|nr:hypothetical protein [Chlamydiales bacterium]